MGLIHLVRHGQASAGTHDYDRLSTIGQHQSRLLGQWWSSHEIYPSAAFHGSLKRQKDTAHLALGELHQQPAMQLAEGLDEYDHRVIESHFVSAHDDYTPEAMSFDEYLQIMTRWRDHEMHQPNKHLEPWHEFRTRGLKTLQASLPAPESACGNSNKQPESVFFTSGGVIATTLASVLELDFEHTIDAIWRIRNSSITSFQNTQRGLRLVEFNAIPHLLEHRDPSLITMI